MIYYNHHDQIRMANPEMGWNVQSADWTKKKITALSKFKIKEGMQDQFFDGWKKGEFKNKKESGFVEAITGSWHLYGKVIIFMFTPFSTAGITLLLSKKHAAMM
jgi:hypothetical protein